ncbi:MAG TPA: hypothetical protein VLQ45_14220 [Thermoanaerobaculia bacterium]|nr:hypothetical protein [Thermoanaerobaculia bacterium]
MVAILVLLTIITCLTIDYLSERAALRRAARSGEASPEVRPVPEPPSVPAKAELKLPKGVFIGPAHIRMELDPGGAVLHHEEEVALDLQEEKEPELVERF